MWEMLGVPHDLYYKPSSLQENCISLFFRSGWHMRVVSEEADSGKVAAVL